MTLHGYLSTEFDIKSPAKEFFDVYIESMDLPKDKSKVKIDNDPLEKKKTTFRMKGLQIIEWYKVLRILTQVAKWQNPDLYKKLVGTMSITHVEGNERDRATLTIEYEKNSSDVEDPSHIMDTFVNFFKVMDQGIVIDSNNN